MDSVGAVQIGNVGYFLMPSCDYIEEVEASCTSFFDHYSP